MALTVSLPAAGAQVGPGRRVSVTGAAGPTALNDVCLCSVESATGSTLMQGNSLFNGSTFTQLTIGVLVDPLHGLVAKIVDYAAGDAVQLRLARFTHAGSLIEQTVTTGFVLDPVSGLWVLAALLLEQGGTAGLAAVLAAVQRSYTTP